MLKNFNRWMSKSDKSRKMPNYIEKQCLIIKQYWKRWKSTYWVIWLSRKRLVCIKNIKRYGICQKKKHWKIDISQMVSVNLLKKVSNSYKNVEISKSIE